jgi:hypothetical protein
MSQRSFNSHTRRCAAISTYSLICAQTAKGSVETQTVSYNRICLESITLRSDQRLPGFQGFLRLVLDCAHYYGYHNNAAEHQRYWISHACANMAALYCEGLGAWSGRCINGCYNIIEFATSPSVPKFAGKKNGLSMGDWRNGSSEYLSDYMVFILGRVSHPPWLIG